MRKYNYSDFVLTKGFMQKECLLKTDIELSKELNLSLYIVHKKRKEYKIPICNRYLKTVGKKYNKIFILNLIKNNKGKHKKARCVCDCGKSFIGIISRIVSGKRKSCGCLLLEDVGKKRNSWKGYEEISGKYFSSLRRCSKNRDIKFDIKIKNLWDKYIKQERKCKLSGVKVNFGNIRDKLNHTASIDRIDPKKHYNSSNIQVVHKHINKMKWNLSEDYFIQACNNIFINKRNLKNMNIKEILNKTFLEQECLTKTDKKIAEEIGVSSTTIGRYRKKYEISKFSLNTNKINKIKGKRFGRLVVLGHSETKNNKNKVKVICDCGKKTTIIYSNMTSKKTRSCGCLKIDQNKMKNKEKSRNWRGYKEISKTYFSIVESRAKKSNLKFEIDIKDMWSLFKKQKRKCFFTGWEIDFGDGRNFTASIDRIDSKLGYIKGNIQFVHKDVNMMKNNFEQKYFIKMCCCVANNN